MFLGTACVVRGQVDANAAPLRGVLQLIRRSKSRQLRTPFCVSSVSPLVQRYLNLETSTIGKPVRECFACCIKLLLLC